MAVTFDLQRPLARKPDLVKPARQHVPQETADKLRAGQRHLTPGVLLSSVILVAKAHRVMAKFLDAMVADGYPVGIAADVAHHFLGIAKGRFTVDHPVAGDHCIEKTFER